MVFYSAYHFERIFKLNENYQTLFNFGRRNVCKFDRTGLFTKFPGISNSLFPLSDLDYNKDLKVKNFNEMCLKRANEILEQHNEINIFWSGGLDSNVVLLSIDNCASKNNIINIKLTPGSIDDSPWIFENIVKKYNYDIMNEFEEIEKHYSLTHPNVMGDCSDCIINFPRPKENVTFDNFNEDDKLRYDLIEETISACPIKIDDTFSMYWWLNFNFDYQFEQLKFSLQRDFDDYKKSNDMNISFFGSDDWQIFSVQFYDEMSKIERDPLGVFKIEHLALIKKLAPKHKFGRNVHPRAGNVLYKHITQLEFIIFDDNFKKIKPISLDFVNPEYLLSYCPKLDLNEMIEADEFIKRRFNNDI